MIGLTENFETVLNNYNLLLNELKELLAVSKLTVVDVKKPTKQQLLIKKRWLGI